MMKKDLKIKIGFYIIGLATLVFLIGLFYIERKDGHYIPFPEWNPTLLFIISILLIASLNFIFNLTGILFDNEEYLPNREIKDIVKKIRFRGVLFNNIAIILFLLIILIILSSFYLLVSPPVPAGNTQKNLWDSLTIRVGASVLLIFLVQILFKVFKYLLRVAAFYNARADAIEFHMKDQKIELDKLMDLFTPDKYDISELEKTSVLDSIAGIIKSKAGKGI